METLVTQTAIFPFRGTISIILILLLQVVSLIEAQQENLDPLEFTLSANHPKNKTLQPLPKHFDKGGDNRNDCCTLVLFFEITDFEEGSGVDPPKSDGAATFKFQHPNIRETDLVFSMGIPKDQDEVKSRHILNFDKCSSIIRKTFSIFATTNITDYKEVRVVLVNGKFEVPAIKCQVPTTIKPLSNNSHAETTQIPIIIVETSFVTTCLAIGIAIALLVSVCCVVALIYMVKVYIPHMLKTNNMNMQSVNEKCVPGTGKDSDDDQEKYEVRGGGRNKVRGGARNKNREGAQIEKCTGLAGGFESDDEEESVVQGGDETPTLEQKAKKVKKILLITAICGILLAFILTVVIFTT